MATFSSTGERDVIGATINSDRFMWHKDSRSFSAEASELRGINFTGQLYNDAADTGFVMKSIRTGAEACFFLEEEHKDNEGDITHWTFKPTGAAIRRQPALNGVHITIFND